MREPESFVNRAAARVGAWMFISWVLIVGPIGFVLLLGLAYAMHFGNLALGIICAVLVLSPLLLVAAWLPLMGASLIVERTALRAREAAEVEPTA